MGPLTAEIMESALRELNRELSSLRKVELIMGGGGAMILGHGFPLGTTDIDAIPRAGISSAELDPLVHRIADRLGLPKDWLNPYFSTFVHTLPSDYEKRLLLVFEADFLKVYALGKEEMLIMKCFAHRRKDVGHARALIREKADIDLVESRIEELQKKKIRGADDALAFLLEVMELEGI